MGVWGGGHFEALFPSRVAKYVLLKALALRIGSGRLRGGCPGGARPPPFLPKIYLFNAGQNLLI